MKTSFDKFMASSAVQEVSNVELSEVKVELALMDDIKALIGKYKSLDDAIKTQKGKTFTSVKTFQDSIKTAYQNAQSAVALIDQLDAKSKELGIADSGLGGYKKELAAKASEYKSKFTKLDSVLSSL
jgi:myosin heavy subunit